MKKIIAISLFLPVLAVANGEENCCFQGMMDFGHIGDSWVLSLLFWVTVIFFIIEIGKVLSARSGNKSAVDILKERYAKGEIDKREFEEKQKDLEK